MNQRKRISVSIIVLLASAMFGVFMAIFGERIAFIIARMLTGSDGWDLLYPTLAIYTAPFLLCNALLSHAICKVSLTLFWVPPAMVFLSQYIFYIGTEPFMELVWSRMIVFNLTGLASSTIPAVWMGMKSICASQGRSHSLPRSLR